MRVVFFGSGPFALPALERLHECSRRAPLSAADTGPPLVELVRVVTRPDRPQRRGRQLVPTPVRARAVELGLPCDAPEGANEPDFLDSLAALSPDLITVADYGEMLRKRLRELPRIGVFNLHASLLPRHRGAAPVVHAILHGEEETGVTLFRIEKRLDSGPIVDAARAGIGPLETAGELEPRLGRLAADLLERNLEAFASGSFREAPQDESLATIAPKIEKRAGAIPWNASALEVSNLVRAFNPWPGAFSFLGAERTIFLRVRPCGAALVDAALPPGSVEDTRRDGFRVRCGSGAVEVLQLQREGKAPLDAAAYLRGRPLKPGDRFTMAEAGLAEPLKP